MRRLFAVPALLIVASIIVAFPGTRLGVAADRFAHGLEHWARGPLV